MNETTRLVMALTTVCVASAVVLAFVYEIAKPFIEEAKLAELKEALQEVLPSSERFSELSVKPQDIERIFKGFDTNNNIVGVAYLVSGKGYQDYIKILVGVDVNTKTITKIKILEHTETPGLGSRIEDNTFIDKFVGKQDVSDIDAITGATISSTAVIESVQQSLPLILNLIDEEKIR
jgi:electron transport complex protein RnfG